ncbi:stage III sporulation protein AB [Romboutsia sp. 1001713B170207_170306_H8]|uniref:stage III sporulation protein AB n=1 Tax=Romboutsia sp. 1001713B170207_170306_H8 TaxID=2787112 RepID=UPI0008234540|nr:stage III sporulation protein AB [Romboutsia sp. 1001713B170207_170306_H8]SCH12178.1 stage III sporulation protein SpoAB [uncultured Clostridium sp.]
MQIKVIIIGILVGCSYLIGDFIHKSYIKRHKEINDLIRILEIIRIDLSFGLYTLEEIFSRIGEKKEYCFYKFFKALANDLNSNKEKVLDEIVEDNLFILTNETYLQNKEVDELKTLILTLGKSDVTSQERMINLSVENLKNLTTDSKEDISKKGNLYKQLIMFLGIGIGIILI